MERLDSPLDLPGESVDLSLGSGSASIDESSYDALTVIKSSRLEVDASLSNSMMEGREILSLRVPDQINRYHILRRVGQGAMGAVYEAFDEKLQRSVAMKIVFAEAVSGQTLKRFEREARIAAGFKHPNVIHVYDYGVGEGFVYYTMDFEGANLETVMEGGKPLKEKGAIEVAIEALQGLAYIHNMGVVHRDLKPSNLLVSADGNLMLADFSLARSDEDVTLTRSHAQIGTPRYMSPEQVKGNVRAVDRRSDLYSMGVVLYLLLTGKHPFDGKNFEEIKKAILSSDPELNGNLSAPMRRILTKALENEPSRRYQTAEEMIEDLQRVLRGEELTTEKNQSFWESWGIPGLWKEHRRRLRLEDSQARPHLDRGDELLEQKRYADAEKEFREAIAKSPECADAYLKLGLAIKGNQSKQDRFYGIETWKNNDHMELSLMNNPAKAKQMLPLFSKAIQYNPNSFRSWLERAKIHFVSDRHDLAIQDLLQAASLRPNDPIIWFLLGQSYFNTGQHNLAGPASFKWEQLRHLASLPEEVPPVSQAEGIQSLAGQTKGDENGRSLFESIPEEIGKYEVVRKIGAGGMGVVYEAKDAALNRRVAIKMLPRFADEKARERFEKEIKSLTQLDHHNHPQVVQVYEAGEVDGRPYYVMEYVDGKTLAEQIKDRRMDSREAAGVVVNLAGAIHRIHHKKIIHGDLKPANVILDNKTRQYIVTDFGLARFSDEVTLGAHDQIAGTPSYMSLEQANGEDPTNLSDIYSLGATLFELVTGQRPFRGSSVYEILEKVKQGEFARPTEIDPNIPADLEAIILRAMAFRLGDRYGTMEEFQADLERFLNGEKVLARPLRWWQKLGRRVSRFLFPLSQEEREANRFRATPFYEAGDQAFFEENLDRAYGEYLRAVELDPDYAAAYTKLGIIASRRGNLDEALEFLSRAIELEPNSPLALTERGNLHLERGEVDKARADFEAALKIRDDFADAHFGLGVCYLADQNKPEFEGRSQFLKSLQINPDNLIATLFVYFIRQEDFKLSDYLEVIPPEERSKIERLWAVLKKAGRIKDEADKQEQPPTNESIEQALKDISWSLGRRSAGDAYEFPYVGEDIHTLAQSKDPRAVELLIRVLENDLWIRYAGLNQTLPSKIGIRAQNDSAVRYHSIVALGELKDKRAVEVLGKVLFFDYEPANRQAAVQALGKIGGPLAVKALIELLERGDKDLVLSAIEALGELKARDAVEPLIKKMESKNESVEIQAKLAYALGKIGDVRTTEVLLEEIDSPHDEIIDAAFWALYQIKDPQAVGPLLERLDSTGNSSSREKIMTTLGVIGDKRAVEPLIKFIEHHSDLEFLDFNFLLAAVEALGKIGDPRAIPLVNKILKDNIKEGGRLRVRTFLALARLGVRKPIGSLIADLEKLEEDNVWQEERSLARLYDITKDESLIRQILEKTDRPDATIHLLSAMQFCKIGLQHLESGSLDLAEKAYQKALELDSEYSQPHLGLGRVYARRNEDEKALAELNKAKELDPQNFEVQTEIAEIYLKQGKRREAQAAFETVVQENEKLASKRNVDAAIYGLGGCFLARGGNLYEAIEQFKKASGWKKEMEEAIELFGNDQARKIESGSPERAESLRKIRENLPDQIKRYLFRYLTLREWVNVAYSAETMEEAFGLDFLMEQSEAVLLYGGEDDRIKAVRLLGYLEDPRAVELLLKVLKDPYASVREEGIKALQLPQFLKTRPRVVEALWRAAKEDSEFKVRRVARDTLIKLGEDRLTVLRDALKDPDGVTRSLAIDGIAEFLERLDVIDLLVGALKDPHDAVRMSAVGVLLAARGMEQRRGMPQILPAIWTLVKKEPHETVRGYALANMDALGANSLEVLIQKLRDPSVNIRLGGLHDLWELNNPRIREKFSKLFPKKNPLLSAITNQEIEQSVRPEIVEGFIALLQEMMAGEATSIAQADPSAAAPAAEAAPSGEVAAPAPAEPAAAKVAAAAPAPAEPAMAEAANLPAAPTVAEPKKVRIPSKVVLGQIEADLKKKEKDSKAKHRERMEAKRAERKAKQKERKKLKREEARKEAAPEPPAPPTRQLEGPEGCAVGRDCNDVASHMRVNALIEKACQNDEWISVIFNKVYPEDSVEREIQDFLCAIIQKLGQQIEKEGDLKKKEELRQAFRDIWHTTFVFVKPKALAADQIPTLLWSEGRNRFQLAHAGTGGPAHAENPLQQAYISYGLIDRMMQASAIHQAALLLRHEARHARERNENKISIGIAQTNEDDHEVEAILDLLAPFIEKDVAAGASLEKYLGRRDSRPSLPKTNLLEVAL